jgi:hypothetical protein
MKLFSTIIILFFALQSNGQITWEKLFSGTSTDVFRSVREVPGGGYVAAGYTSNFNANDTDAFVVRMDQDGDTMWTYQFNGPMSKKDLFYKIIPTLDGGFALCGYTSSISGFDDDLLYVKLNSSGQQQWVKYYGGTGKERGQDIVQTSDGNFTIVGYTTTPPAQYYDAFMLRADSNGDTLWTKLYGSSNYDDANAVRVLSDGGYILGGQSDNPGNGFDQFLIRTDASGNVIWTNKLGTLGTDNVESIVLVADGFILGGSSSSVAGGDDDGYLVKTDTAGIQMWAKMYGDTAPDDIHRVESTTDGGFIMSGTTSSYGDENPNIWMVKTNSTGDTLWNKTFGRHNHDHGYSGQQTSDGGYIVVGHTGSFGYNYEESYIAKLDGSGNIINQMTYTSVFDMLNPLSNSCGDSESPLEIVIKNYGRKTVMNVPLTISVTGAATSNFTETYNIPLEAEVTDTITLTNFVNTSAGGTYTFTFTTGNVNDVYPQRNTFSKTVTLNSQPSLNLGPDTAVSDSTFILDAGPGLQYAWDTGTNAQTYTVITTGNYCVTVTGSNSCTNTDCVYVVVSVGVDEIKPLVNSIYPNPASNKINLELLSNVKEVNYQLMNSSGKILRTSNFRNSTTIDVSSFSKGIYFLKVIAEDGVETKKIIIE